MKKFTKSKSRINKKIVNQTPNKNTSATNWTINGVINEIKKIDQTMNDRHFAFILGAGASFSSDIPTGKKLAETWLNELYEQECLDQVDLDEWIKKCNIEGLTRESIASCYPKIFDRRFGHDRDSGYAALEHAMEGKTPSIGYAVLAEILQKTRHKVVITTNFDNLVADALATYAHKSPLVVAHESLTGFVRPHLRRPLIAKIHRDLLLNPINDTEGVGSLGLGWSAALKKIFQYYTPIVIGYGGNDGSLMNFLKSLTPDEITGRIFWCYKIGDPPPSIAEDVLKKHNGIKVGIEDFDNFMEKLAYAIIKNFDIKELINRPAEIGKIRSQDYAARGKYSPLQEEIENPPSTNEEQVSKEINWRDWLSRADAQPDIDLREEIYKKALQQFPDNLQLITNYSHFLFNNKKHINLAKQQFEKALKQQPENAKLIGNYALLLTTYTNDFDEAEKYFKISLKLDPQLYITLGNYANFLTKVRKDHLKAKELYKKSLEIRPSYESAINYAMLLGYELNEEEEAIKNFQKSIELSPDNPIPIEKYATYLSDRPGKSTESEKYYKKSLALDPNQLEALANYSILLSHKLEKQEEAKSKIRKAMDISPDNQNLISIYSSILMMGSENDMKCVSELTANIVKISKNTPDQSLAEALLYDALCDEVIFKKINKTKLSHLKHILNIGYKNEPWDFSDIFNKNFPKIEMNRQHFYKKLGDAVLDIRKINDLEDLSFWKDIPSFAS